MSFLDLKIITPRKLVVQEKVYSVTAPTEEGEITVLPHHARLFTVLKEGIIKIKKPEAEDYFAIGAGYLETDGVEVNILVSKAYGQDAIDKELTEKAIEEAKKILSQAKDEKQRAEALAMMRRAVIDSKILKKRKTKSI